MGVQVVIARPHCQREIARFPDVDAISVGRDASCHVRLEHPGVSREHVHVYRDGDRMVVEDRSTNGTLVGGKWLKGKRKALGAETSVQVGPVVLHFDLVQAGSNERASVAPRKRAQRRSRAAPERVPVPAVPNELRRRLHRLLLQQLDLVNYDPAHMDRDELRPRVVAALRQVVGRLAEDLPRGTDQARLIGELTDEALGLGPLEPLLADPGVTEIMVVDPQTIFVERDGVCRRVEASFTDNARMRAVVERIVTPLGRRIDESQPLVDARLPDGSRVNAIISPLALRGTCITIRKFPSQQMTLADLERTGSMGEEMGRFLVRCVKARKNIVVSGGTSSGKTTILNILSSAIGEEERVVTIEDAAELRLRQPHVVALESRPPNLEGEGAYTIRDLVRNALRMRPDRIIVGECRGGEALDMLLAMNTGHEGSLTTVHANSPREALARLETLCLMGGVDLPSTAVREQLANSMHIVVQVSRLPDGSRKTLEISEINGLDRRGQIRLRTLYRFFPQQVDQAGRMQGHFGSTGYLPSFLMEFLKLGLIQEGEKFL